MMAADVERTARDVEGTARDLWRGGQPGAAPLVASAAVYLARAAATAAAIDPELALAAEVDRLAPGWRVDVGDALVRIPPMRCPRCGELCVLIEWPPRRRMMGAWREVTADALAAAVDRYGVTDARGLRHHDAWRCDRARGAVDLDTLTAG